MLLWASDHSIQNIERIGMEPCSAVRQSELNIVN